MRGTGCVAFYKSPEAAARERKAIDVWQQVVVCTTLLIAAGCSARRAPSLAIVTRWQPLSWPGGRLPGGALAHGQRWGKIQQGQSYLRGHCAR